MLPTETLVALLRARADQDPHAVAYTYLRDGELDAQSLTYGALDRWARALAARIQEQAKPGDRALVLAPAGLDFIAAFFACLYAGVVAVPLPPPQRKRALPRLLAVARDCQPALVVASEALRSGLEAQLHDEPALGDLRSARWFGTDAEQSAASETAWRDSGVRPQDVAFIQYTSGSTGSPKGVVLTHDNLLHNERAIERAFGHSAQSVIVGWLPPHHDMGLIGNVLQPLYLGARSVFMAPQHFLAEPRRWLAAISRYGGTTSGGPNFAYDICVREIAAAARADLDLRSWRVAFNGAEPVRARTLEAFAQAFEPCGFRRAAFYPCYGLAEATLLVSGGEAGAGPRLMAVERGALEQGRGKAAQRHDDAAQWLIGCGRTQLADSLIIVDPERGAPCEAGDIGEIWVRGPSVGRGYWGRPEESERVFGAALEGVTGQFLRTGDLGFVLDGELYVTGRLKDLVISRGRNLYPQDLELSAEQSHAALRPAGGAVFSVDQDGEERIVAVHEVAPREPAALAEAAGAIRRAIAEQHEVQLYAVVLLRLGGLPRTTSGKVQRSLCRARFLGGTLEPVWQQVAGPDSPGGATGAAPQGELERAIAEVWEEVLDGVRASRDDSFAALGGDSLRAVQASARLQVRCGVEVNPAVIFDAASLAALAEWIEARRREGRAAPAPALGSAQPDSREPAPLSFAQERMWFLEELAGGAPILHVGVALRLSGQLELGALERAIFELELRHEALRTVFESAAGRRVQRAAAAQLVALPVSELSEPAQLSAWLRAQARRPFDWDGRAPVRWELARIGPTEHVLLFACHHLVSDGASMQIAVRELLQLYAAGGPSALGPVPLQAGAFALAQRARCAGRDERLRADLEYWTARLKGGVPVLRLPLDRPRPERPSHLGGRHTSVWTASFVARVRARARAQGATLFSAALAALLALLARESGETDLCIGVPVAGRGELALEAAVGCFINTLALRFDLASNPRAGELITRVRREIQEAQAHQAVPFEQVVEAVRPERSASHSPLFQVMFSMQPERRPLPRVPGLQVSADAVDMGAAQLDLALDLEVGEDGGQLVWEYDAELFEPRTIEALAARYQRVLQAMVERADERVSELALLGETERAELLVLAGSAPVAQHVRAVHERFEHHAARQPKAIALVFGEERLSYRELNERANRLAHHLRRRGVGPETRVALALGRSAELVLGALAVLKAGAAYVPLDLGQPLQRRAAQLADARVSLLIGRGGALEAAAPSGLARVCLERDAAAIAAEVAHNSAASLPPERLAYVLYTSGSSGEPKGVLVTQAGLAAVYAAWQRVYEMAPGELRLLQLASPAFDVWTAEWVRALGSGGTLIVAPEEAARDPRQLTALARREAVTCLDLVPAWIAPLLRQWEDEGQGLAGLRWLIVGSDAWSLREYRELRSRCAAQTRILSCYGLTEGTIDSAYFEGIPPASLRPEALVPLGRPFDHARLYVLDRGGQLQPRGSAGELAVGGAALARGYLGRPQLTAERFIPDPFGGEPGARLYRTGDRVRWLAEGVLEFLGRIDQQLKLRGVRVEPAEIEAALLRHPDVSEAVVSLSEQGAQKRLVAHVVARPGCALDAAELRAFVRGALPEALVPAVHAVDALPLTVNGKVDRRALGERAARLQPDAAAQRAPRSELEQQIAQIWQELLGLETVGTDDGFFDLGGHSLLLAEVARQLRLRLRREIALIDLVRHPTIGALAAALAAPTPCAAPGAAAQAAGHPQCVRPDPAAARATGSGRERLQARRARLEGTR